MRASIVVGIDRTSYLDRNKLYRFLSALDICFSSLVIAPLVVAFWSSTWSSLKFIQFQDYPWLNVFMPIAFGFSVSILFTAFQKQIQVSWSFSAAWAFAPTYVGLRRATPHRTAAVTPHQFSMQLWMIPWLYLVCVVLYSYSVFRNRSWLAFCSDQRFCWLSSLSYAYVFARLLLPNESGASWAHFVGCCWNREHYSHFRQEILHLDETG